MQVFLIECWSQVNGREEASVTIGGHGLVNEMFRLSMIFHVLLLLYLSLLRMFSLNIYGVNYIIVHSLEFNWCAFCLYVSFNIVLGCCSERNITVSESVHVMRFADCWVESWTHLMD